MCDALEVSVSGYYAWASRADSAAERRRRELVAAIREVHAEVRERYGSPRMTAELNARGHACSENTVARLMTAHDIRARTPRRFVRTTDSGHAHPVADNRLDREFTPARPNAAWSADITYVPTREGWVYLAVVEDLYSRMIVGWSMAATTESRLVVDALELAGPPPSRGRAARALGPREPVRERALPTRPHRGRDRVQHERGGAVLG